MQMLIRRVRRASVLFASRYAASVTVASALAMSGAAFGAAAPATPPPLSSVATNLLAGLPQSFEANAGQAGSEVEFLCRGAGSTLLLSHGDAILAPHREGNRIIRLRLAGKARHPLGEGRLRQTAVTNYLLGADHRQWHTDIPNYGEVRYRGVYRGIDLIYRGGDHRHFEYDFVVAPGADLRQIRLAFENAPSGDRGGPPSSASLTGEAIHLGPHGELIVPSADGELVQPAPVIYQEVANAGGRRAIAGRYVLVARPAGRQLPGRVEVGFEVDAFDALQPLVIDPQIVYSTFLGGSGDDYANGIAVDPAGNAYLTGVTYSSSFPGVGASSIQPKYGPDGDVFLIKIDAAGTGIVYSTFLGSGNDFGSAIAVDAAGNAYLTGSTGTDSFPGVSWVSIQPTYGGDGDAFVIKVNSAGNGIVYSTFLGGTGDDYGTGIAVDASGNAYVTGGSSSSSFPGMGANSIQPGNAGGGDAFLAKINPNGTALVYATFLGGSGYDVASSIALDPDGIVYLAGITQSSIFPGIGEGAIQPLNAGGGDAFVVKVNATGTAIVYATFLGGSGNDQGIGIAVDAAGAAYVVGFTSSTSFPGVGPGSLQPTFSGGGAGFVTKINPAGTAIVYSTYLGGGVTDAVGAVAVDRAGIAYVTGNTSATSFPGVNSGSIQRANSGGGDAFLAEIDPAGTAIVYSTFLGGSGSDSGFTIAIDASGNAYIAGLTTSATFPGVSGSSLQPANAGGADGYDAFVTKVSNPNAHTSFYTLAPCRVFDTRNSTPLAAGEARRFQVSGLCGVPSIAKAISANVTVVAPQQPGFLNVLPGDAALDLSTTSTLNFSAGQVLANNAIVLLSYSGAGTIYVVADLPSGTTHVLLDIDGYFQ
ncbi:MAG TPA: SBBP repeat-containing protein [Thermoanaerobaculia bacterium]|jgi:hypothetical protein|nr:SBBP repeat-containing protein [Thermoanaerobaculia bacterium]